MHRLTLTAIALTALVITPSFFGPAPAIGLGTAGGAEWAAPAALLRAAPSAARHPDAGVYWLRQEITQTLHTDGTTEEAHHDTARIFNQRGMEKADVTIPFSALSQSVTGIEARTIRPDGTVLRLNPADIHETSPYSEFTEYDDARNKAFSLPGVEEDAIIDYRYVIVTHKPLCPGRFADSCWLADSDPSRVSRYTLIAPASVHVQARTHNAAGVQFTSRLSADGQRRIECWEMRDTPPLREEPDAPSQETYSPWLEISTWPSWQAVSHWYQGLAARRMAPTPSMIAFARRLTAGQTTETGKAKAVFYWVETKTRYVAVELGLSAYQPHPAAAVWQNRYGDCKDMATLLIALLRGAGVRNAWPALLDTENKLPRHGHLATPALFDHVIVRAQLDGKPYWFDATAEYCPFGEIPGGDRGLEALVVRSDSAATFETIPWGTEAANRVVFQKTVTLRADGSADCRDAVLDTGEAGLSDRSRFLDLKPEELPGAFQDVAGGQTQLSETFESAVSGDPDAALRRFSLSACADLDAPMAYSVDYQTPAGAVRTGSLLILSDGFSFSPPTGPARRQHPLFIDGGAQVVYTLTAHLPHGYAPLALPDDVQMGTAAGTVEITYRASLGTLVIRKELTLHPGSIPPSDYPRLRDSLERAALLERRPIVLGPVRVQQQEAAR